MIKIIDTRGSGKTTKLLKLAYDEELVIVEPTNTCRRLCEENGKRSWV